MRMIALIIANGTLEEYGAWAGEIRRAALVVAADGGARHARALGLVPQAVVGDGDSLDAETAGWMEERGAARVLHPPAKDETDLELALLYAVEAGATEIAILAAWGGRPDQALANLQLLAHERLAGRRVRLLGADYEALVLRGGEAVTLAASIGDTISLLPLGGEARGVRAAGLRWPLAGETLRFGPARGVSNEAVASPVEVRLEEGLLLVVHLLTGPSSPPDRDGEGPGRVVP